jgi:hypothetical protein
MHDLITAISSALSVFVHAEISDMTSLKVCSFISHLLRWAFITASCLTISQNHRPSWRILGTPNNQHAVVANPETSSVLFACKHGRQNTPALKPLDCLFHNLFVS